jgi:hypothetical protein
LAWCIRADETIYGFMETATTQLHERQTVSR